ncbi:MAG: ABC transporter ATP-binding protein [Eubacteriales bacterium]
MKTLIKLLRLAREYRSELIITVAALICASALSLVPPEVIRRFTAALTSPEGITTRLIVTYVLILVAAYFLRALCRFASMYKGHVAAWSFVAGLTLKIYDKYQSLSMKYYNDKQTGQLMSRMINDTRMLEVLIAHALPDLITNAITVIGVTVMIFLINPMLAAITVIPVPFVFWASSIFSKKIAPLFRINQRVLGELNGKVQDKLTGMREIQAFSQEKAEHEAMTKECGHYAYVNIHANFANAIFHPSVEFLTCMGTVAVVGIGGALALSGHLSVADTVGFFMYLTLFYTPLSTLARLVEDISSSVAGGERVLQVLEEESDVKQKENAEVLENPVGKIEFENVTFSYDGTDEVLKDISFTAEPGQMIALVGPTGVGKTTIVSLLERFYDVKSGAVRVDGHDVRDLTLDSLRASMSMVLQDVFLFNGTIAENIAYGAGKCPREEIIEAAKIACADEFINTTPDGYDTLIGERGVRLSGGQKQRIAIARAVLRRSPILIMDEATSAVDTETEAAIREAVGKLVGSRTMIVIAHRLSTVMKADKIIVLDDGKICETGTHEELIAKGGLYSRLCGAQIK